MRQHLCCFPNCVELIPINKRYCNTHKNEAIHFNKDKEKEEKKDTNKYSKDWIIVQRLFLRKNPYCFRCGAKATEVHHQLGHYKTNDDLEQLCSSCHRQIGSRRQRLREWEEQHNDDNIEEKNYLEKEKE